MAWHNDETPSSGACSQSNSVRVTIKASRPTTIQPKLRASRTDSDFAFDGVTIVTDNAEVWKSFDEMAALGLALESEIEPCSSSRSLSGLLLEDDMLFREGKVPHNTGPFHKWIKTLQKRTRQRLSTAESTDFEKHIVPHNNEGHYHRKSSSGSSYSFVQAVKSASVSVASGSIATRSRKNTIRSRHRKSDQSNRGSTSQARRSEDSTYLDRSMNHDSAVTARLIQRRRIVEELISTEEGYIGDIKFLMNVYITILASLPAPHIGLRSSVNRNLTEIIELHEDILGELHRAVPCSEYTHTDSVPRHKIRKVKGHHRWHSLDSVSEQTVERAWPQNILGMMAEPSVAAEVARIFGERMGRFFIYEEYGAKYEMMIKDIALAHQAMPHWNAYQKGLEALAASLGSVKHRLDGQRKSLTVGDLLVKPIQRVCKYPLLFAELLKQTPACDCPNSHADITNVLARLREATSEINRATDNPQLKKSIKTTWLLQDRLAFPNQELDPWARATIRAFGKIRLCGVLHVCWQTKEGVDGQYMIVLLYNKCFCLATARNAEAGYTLQACLNLKSMKVEDIDNGRGLQCHTAPFSWKLVFEVDHQLFEAILTACTAKEEVEWRTRLEQSSPPDANDSSESKIDGFLFLNIKSLGTIFGKPGTVARRLSIHRATTVGPKSPLCQVVLKNTAAARDSSPEISTLPINRSQSLLTTNTRIPVLAPPRAERARLEALITDVWSHGDLPFPGMTYRFKSEHYVRTSASSMIRKLSVASIASSFTKRSTSAAGPAKTTDDEFPHINSFIGGLVSINCDASHPDLQDGVIHEDEYGTASLSMIRDETENASSTSLSNRDIDRYDSSDTVYISPARPEANSNFNVPQHGTPALNTSAANSIRHTKHTPPPAGSKSVSPCPSEKENIRSGQSVENPVEQTLVDGKTTTKWPKVTTVIHRRVVAQSIRSLFR